MSDWKPQLRKEYRILAIAQKEYQDCVGRVITLHACIPASGGMFQVIGFVHGKVGQWEFTCALQRESGNCMCEAYSFPHKPGQRCKAMRKLEH